MIYTTGVYSQSEEEFFEKLKIFGIATFWDIRARRGMRGSKYSFVNSTRLQIKLSELGIKYRYIKELAPSDLARKRQKEIDSELGHIKRDRQSLSDEFIESYTSQFSQAEWIELSNKLSLEIQPVVLFCVESFPEACHRSFAAKKISEVSGLDIKNI